jgi:hypothetical protein
MWNRPHGFVWKHGTARLKLRLMPLHFYAPAQLPCKLCGTGFEHRATSAEELTACPTCGQSIARQRVQTVTPLKLSTGRGVSRAKQAGFAVLKRVSDGGFEKQ